MTETEHDQGEIRQCPVCGRFFNAALEWVTLSAAEGLRLCREGRLGAVDCGATDCAAVAEQLAIAERERARARIAGRMERRREMSGKVSSGKCQGRRAKAEGSRLRAKGGEDVAARASLPYATRNEEDERTLGRAEGSGLMAEVVAGTSARDLGQAGFVESGAADRSNLAIIEFFEKPENFGLWFSAKMLVNIVMKQQSMHMNNRAVDVRPHFLRKGLYLDNFMMSPQEFAGKVSCYRLCKLAEALSLSNEQKDALATEYGIRPETGSQEGQD